ncbi:MAG: ABC transporter permease [Nisaea sp.]|uniref:ABC transporter permease n=1 Tax=Nisaea sp. TaxID=2024842 RepID=UPI001B1B9B3F|nr:ABC transporter permease [Nisaea sp.]MBO6560369.1 ABC transporter permease [Nisaea sp.]
MRALLIILRLGIKEIYSLARDPVLMGLIVYTFSVSIYTVADGVETELRDAAVAIVDEDDSALSHRLRGAFLPPYFKPPAIIGIDEVDRALDKGLYTFVVDIPANLEADIQRRRGPVIQLSVDATAMSIAGNGAGYISEILTEEIAKFMSRGEPDTEPPALLKVRVKYNPNLEAVRFNAVMEVINNIVVMAIILTGAAVIREREHGTIEHLLVMPVSAAEIMISKIWANGLVILLAVLLSLEFVVRRGLGVPLYGSMELFAAGACIFLFCVTALGIMLATFTHSMPQFALLCIPVFVVINLLSGGHTPLESMPEILQTVMQVSPSTHFIRFSQAVIYRDATLGAVWPELAIMLLIGCVFFAFAFVRFRASMAAR